MPMTITLYAERSPEASSAAVSKLGLMPMPSNRFRNQVAGAHDVADAESGRELHIDFAGLEFRGCVLVVRAQAGIADAVPAGLVVAAGGMCDRLDGVGAGLRLGRRNGEQDRIGVAGGLAMELGLCGLGAPAFGELERDGSSAAACVCTVTRTGRAAPSSGRMRACGSTLTPIAA